MDGLNWRKTGNSFVLSSLECQPQEGSSAPRSPDKPGKFEGEEKTRTPPGGASRERWKNLRNTVRVTGPQTEHHKEGIFEREEVMERRMIGREEMKKTMELGEEGRGPRTRYHG